MSFKLKMYFLIFLTGFYVNPIQAQLKHHDNLEVRVASQVQQDGDSYVYKFVVENKNSSVQKLETIRIEIGDSAKNKGGTISGITKIKILGNKWAGWASETKVQPRNKNAQGLVVWVANYDSIKNISDTFAPPESALEPGESQIFSITSEGLPRVMRYFARGWNEPYTVSEYDSLRYIAGYSADEVSPPWYEDAYQGRTIAPVLSPDPFEHSTFLDTLINQARQAQSLGWISDQNFATALSNRLQQTRDRLAAGDSVEAATTLSDFVEVVKATNAGQGPPGASLTSEGYALLYYNAKYLLDRLPEPPGSGITCRCAHPVTQSSGTITVNDGQTRCLSEEFSGSVFFQTGGTLNVCGTADLKNIYGNQAGQVNVSETGQVTVGNWNNNFSEDRFTNWGTTEFTGTVTVNNGTLTNHGELTVGGDLNQNNGDITNSGQLDVSGAVNLNQPTENNGTWTTGGALRLNSGSLSNTCRLEIGNQFTINGDYTAGAGSYTSAGQLTINSGALEMGGNHAMVSAEQLTQNADIVSSNGTNLLNVTNQITYNSGKIIAEGTEPLYVCSPDWEALPAGFEVADGCQLTIPTSPCNLAGFNTEQ